MGGVQFGSGRALAREVLLEGLVVVTALLPLVVCSQRLFCFVHFSL